MASSKTLLKTGSSLMTRFLTSQTPNPTRQLIFQPKLSPSIFTPHSNNPTPFHLPNHQNDVAEQFKGLSFESFLYPCGLPYIPFFLPDARFLPPDLWIQCKELDALLCNCNSVSVKLNALNFMAWFALNDCVVSIISSRIIKTSQEMILLRMGLCSYYQSEHTNQAISGAKEHMDTLLEKRRRVAEELSLGELPRVGSESQRNATLFKTFTEIRFIS